MIPIKDLIGTGKSQTVFSEVDIPRAATYACEDADATWRVASILCPRVEKEGLGDLFRNIELPLIPVLAEMELTGVRVDTAYLQELALEFGEVLKKSEAEIYNLAGESFNINSPKQLGVILFDRIGTEAPEEDKDRPVHLAGRPGAVGLATRLAEEDSRIPIRVQTQIHLCGRTHQSGQPQDRPNPYIVQSGGCSHGSLIFIRPQSAEYPDPYGRGTKNPSGVHS